ncbi:MAG TPA: hypothetical protein VK904_08580 [Miltoncostaeaceae bacterium]|nr:hypothetical protein [Miltoncostaeaceae bacterium]
MTDAGDAAGFSFRGDAPSRPGATASPRTSALDLLPSRAKETIELVFLVAIQGSRGGSARP